jgi:SAM-dependent methyltransferase
VSDGLFDERVAAHYDATSAAMFDDSVLRPTVEFLAALAAGRPVLEFAIGTGRVALPLSERGVKLSGIELSRAMVAQLSAKPGAERIQVTIGDMATTRVDGSFGLVYLVYNTISNLLSQGEQVACFRNAAAHLDAGGHFVIEVEVPMLRRLPPGEVFVPYEVTPHHIGIDEYDVANQRLVSRHYWMEGGRFERFDSLHRYAWPAEYDLMAELAGMTLVDRWANWQRDPFTSESTSHVSVWQRR